MLPPAPGPLYLLLPVPGMFLPLIPTSDFSSSLRSRFGCHLRREQHHHPPPFTLFPFTWPYCSKALLNLNMACGSEPAHLSYPRGPLSIHGLGALEMGPVQVGMWLCQIHSRFLWLDTSKQLGKQLKTALQYFSLSFFFLPHCTVCGTSLARDRTHAPCSGSVESQPLDAQASPSLVLYICLPTVT